MTITINPDMGEALGIHSFGNDTALLDYVDTINVACGMHSGDPSTMARTVTAALDANVSVGAHPGLPDLVGFGRRAMVLTADEVRDLDIRSAL
jgi:5-oxoprolinase (ATP-hydrolysing) subunit A